MATIKEIAKIAGVAISTVSYALNDDNSISSATKDKIKEIARELNYHPSAAARNLKRRKTKNIGVFIYEFGGPIFSSVLNGVLHAANENNYTCIVSSGLSSKAILLQRQVDAAIIFDDHITDEVIINFANLGFPVVVLDRKLAGNNIYELLIDNEKAVYEFISKMIFKGYKDFCYLSGPLKAFNNQGRFNGFKKALLEHHLNFTCLNGDFTIKSGYEIGIKLATSKELPQFIFCGNDESAIGLIQALTEMGIKIPDEVAIAGFDNINLCQYTIPKLSSIDVSHYNWGKDATTFLLQKLVLNKDDTSFSVPTSIILRESC